MRVLSVYTVPVLPEWHFTHWPFFLFVYVFLSPNVSGILSLVDKNEEKCAEDQWIPV